MNWILALVLILVVQFLVIRHTAKKKGKKLRTKFQENWGKPKTDSYYNFSLIESYFSNNPSEKNTFQILSEKTSEDLDLDEVFKFIDRTSSKVGQQYLYFKLRTITSRGDLSKFRRLVTIFEDEGLRLDCQEKLNLLNTDNAYYLEQLLHEETIKIPRNLWMFYALSASSLLCIIFSFFNPIFFLFLIAIFAINMIFHYKNKENVLYYLNGVSQLSNCLKVSKYLASRKKIKGFYTDFFFIKKLKKIQSKTRFIEFEKKLDNEYAMAVWFVAELFKILFNLEYLFFYRFIGAVQKEKESVQKAFKFIGEIDAAISTLSLKYDELKICEPEFTDKNEFFAVNIVHPLIENCVPNTLKLENNSLLLTGSNMSGKTTFIRTIAINAILAETLGLCFAEKFKAPFFKIYSSIRISDNVMDNTSYYLEEVLGVKEMVEASETSENCLFVLDEIFKGTNTLERISAGKAILEYLNKRNHLVLVSTHDVELTELLKNEGYNRYHFDEKIKEEKLYFDHLLKPGPLTAGNAIKILELYKYPKAIIENAISNSQRKM